MAKLTTTQRKKLPSKDFAVPGRKYPINDKNHAKNALARVAAFGNAEEKAEVKSAVKRKYPGMAKDKKAYNKKKGAM